jgi:hypothetical protein
MGSGFDRADGNVPPEPDVGVCPIRPPGPELGRFQERQGEFP